MSERFIVRISRSQLAAFRRKARESRNELFAFLIGNANSVFADVLFLFYPEMDISTPDECNPSEEGSAEAEEFAIDSAMKVIGTIHSHPDGDCNLSPVDHSSMLKEGEKLAGVVAVRNGRTSVKFWKPDTPLYCQVKYRPARKRSV